MHVHYAELKAISCRCFQAINNLAKIDENRERIVEAGALPHYYELSNSELDESVHPAVDYGLRMLRDNGKEPRCLWHVCDY